MLRLVHYGNSMPISFPCDPSAEFESGQVAELVSIGNTIMATVSSGICPIGVIDDTRTKAFTNISWNETVIIPVSGAVLVNNQLVTPYDIKYELRKPNIIPRSFSSTVNVLLNPINGVITIVAGTPLNIDLIGNGSPNGIKAVVNYSYAVANISGDDTTSGSGRVTVWYDRMFLSTSAYEVSQMYALRANLYVSEIGLFTTRKPSDRHPAVAVVTAPPSTLVPYLELLWL